MEKIETKEVITSATLENRRKSYDRFKLKL